MGGVVVGLGGVEIASLDGIFGLAHQELHTVARRGHVAAHADALSGLLLLHVTDRPPGGHGASSQLNQSFTSFLQGGAFSGTRPRGRGSSGGIGRRLRGLRLRLLSGLRLRFQSLQDARRCGPSRYCQRLSLLCGSRRSLCWRARSWCRLRWRRRLRRRGRLGWRIRGRRARWRYRRRSATGWADATLRRRHIRACWR